MNNSIGVLTYDIPHKKTLDTLLLLKAKGINNVKVFGQPLHYEKKFFPLVKHRPETLHNINPKELSRNLGYDYFQKTINNQDLEFGSLVLLCGSGILNQNLIRDYQIVNSHPGYLPHSRGLDAMKWAIINDDPIGVTTHIIGDKIDSGDILERVIIEVYHSDTFHSVAQRVYDTEIKLLVDSIDNFKSPIMCINSNGFELKRRMPKSIEENLLIAFDKYKIKHGVK